MPGLIQKLFQLVCFIQLCVLNLQSSFNCCSLHEKCPNTDFFSGPYLDTFHVFLYSSVNIQKALATDLGRSKSCLLFPAAEMFILFYLFVCFLVLCSYILVGDRTFLIANSFKNLKYIPKLTFLLTELHTPAKAEQFFTHFLKKYV